MRLEEGSGSEEGETTWFATAASMGSSTTSHFLKGGKHHHHHDHDDDETTTIDRKRDDLSSSSVEGGDYATVVATTTTRQKQQQQEQQESRILEVQINVIGGDDDGEGTGEKNHKKTAPPSTNLDNDITSTAATSTTTHDASSSSVNSEVMNLGDHPPLSPSPLPASPTDDTTNTNYLNEKQKQKTFVVIPKQQNNPFFTYVKDGCEYQAKKLTSSAMSIMSSESKNNINDSDHVDEMIITCEYIGPVNPIIQDQMTILQNVLERPPGSVAGIAIAVLDSQALSPLLIKAQSQFNIPVVTFDNDCVPASTCRSTYIGTDNFAMGQTLGKILQQLHPTGGIYGLVSDEMSNVQEREKGVRHHLQQYPQWKESSLSPLFVEDSIPISLDRMEEFAALQHPTTTAEEEMGTSGIDAIIPVGGWPMYDAERWTKFVDNNPNLTLVVGDSLTEQVDLLMKGYADGLVGQVPREMGVESINALHSMSLGKPVNSSITLTFLMELVRLPLELPPLELNNNHIGDLRYLAISLYCIVASATIYCIGWTIYKRKVRVVQTSQPTFLIMIAIGAGILGSALIPLSFDDTKFSTIEESEQEPEHHFYCMAVPWLSIMGFAIAFSALFSKTWRINRIFHHGASRFARVKVSQGDVIVPFVLLVGANLSILIAWTVIDPLKYHRLAHEGTDVWNRVISYYGACRSDESAMPYLASLGVVNMGLLLVANWQVYEARSLQMEFAESKYIGMVMISLLQAGLTGFPILLITSEMPEAFFLILVLMIFSVSMSILFFVFVPKMIHEHKFQSMTESMQRSAMVEAIRQAGSRGDFRPNTTKKRRRQAVVSSTLESDKPVTMSGGMSVTEEQSMPGLFPDSGELEQSQPTQVMATTA